MDIPGFGHVDGEWDLREGIDAYLGNVDLRGKRVLEMGTASGFVCFHMERKGADVVAYDLSGQQDWDVVPYARDGEAAFRSDRKNHIRKLNNAFWLCHRAFKSESKMVYGDAYSVPEDIGMVDVCTFGSILLHLRDPFLALQRALRLTKETVIVTDMLGPDASDGDGERSPPAAANDERSRPVRSPGPFPTRSLRKLAKHFASISPVIKDFLADRDRLERERDELLLIRDRLFHEQQLAQRVAQHTEFKFAPDWRKSEPRETWWCLSPGIVIEFLGVLGFETTEVIYHTQMHSLGIRKLFTVVGHRTAGRSA
jgi:SAM-dependent methyltransferase